MLKRFSHLFLIVALLMATGSHWALLQSVAWTTMLAENLQTHSFTESIARTFDGKHPCRLCCQIAEGKQTDQKTEFPVPLKKLDFLQSPAPLVLTLPRMAPLPAFTGQTVLSLTHQPPVPPPRSLAV